MFDAFNKAFDISEGEQSFAEDDIAHSEEEGRVGAGDDGKPFACMIGSDRSSGIDNDDLTAARLNAVDLCELIGAGK